ncbi:LuxR C-terminal-related transcriptional regulator [Leucobacter sp. 7(1)]|uniref:helix-turn-helix transcriptional regulator n=1 Tax=Leucobacter sp. 7(1) TaxID=1255613 RepID=UPI000B357C1A|nr:LuxR C-terminal-related transcriptional regulator [Leucobacter sp. 7(1)]
MRCIAVAATSADVVDSALGPQRRGALRYDYRGEAASMFDREHSRQPLFAKGEQLMVARSVHVQRIVRYVIDGTSVSVVGQHWSGRTELLTQVAAALKGIGLALVQLRGIEHAAPLEAFRAAMPVAQPQRRGDSDLMSELPRHVTRLLSEGPAAVLVDDIDLLDEASWVLLEQVHKVTGVPIVATAESRGDIDPDERLLIRKAHPVVKLTLEEMRLDATHDLLETRLADRVAPSLSGRIHMKSGGLPGFAVAFADTAQRNGRVRKQGGVWRDGPELWSEELEGPFESLLFRYPEDIRESLEMLVMTGPLPLDDAARLIGQAQLERLEGRGLVRMFTAGSSPRITVNPPGISDYFRHRPPSVRAVRLRQQITETLGDQAGHRLAEPSEAPRPFADVIPQLEIPLLARAFRDAYETSLTRSWNAWLAEPDIARAIAALELRLTGDSPEGEVARILAETPRTGASRTHLLYFRYLHARWLVTHEAPVAEIVEALRGDGDLGHPHAIAAFELGFAAEHTGITPAALSSIEELAKQPGLDGQVASLILIAMHSLGGRPERALAQVAQLDESITWVARFAAPLRGLALVTAGQPHAALEWASKQLTVARERLDRSAMVAQAYVAVMALLTMSRYADATSAGSIVASGQFQAGNLLFGPDRALMNALAIAAARSGRVGSVSTLLERGTFYRGRSDALPMGAEGFPDALLTELDENAEATGAAYRLLARGLHARGYSFSAAGSEMLAMLADFRVSEAEAKRELLAPMGESIFLAYLDARLAQHRRDPGALVDAARWLRREHANDSALKHFTAAARMYRDEGRETQASEVREEIAALMASEDPATDTAIVQLESSLGFTQREREIIDLVADGLNNPAIATELSLSVRTVETHLRNIRRKSGALERTEIGDYASGR